MYINYSSFICSDLTNYRIDLKIEIVLTIKKEGMKKILNTALGLTFIAFVGYNVYCSQSRATVSDVLLENVEAFGYIDPEIENFGGFYLKPYQNGCKICERGDGTCNVHSQEPC